MQIEVTQKINEPYYQEYYGQWLKFKSKYKKWAHKVGFSLTAVAAIVYFANHANYYFSIGLIVLGASMIYEFYVGKKKWLQARLKSKINNNSVEFIFQDDIVKTFGPFSETKEKWNFFVDVLETEKGVFLIPENGISIYLQKKIFDSNSDWQAIIKKIKTRNK